jgi:Cdc6-like AAA superfamily ATPase
MSQYLYYKNGCYCGLNVKVKDNNQYPPNEPIEDCIKRVDQKKGGKAPVSIEGDQLIEVLTKKKQVILYGPPGTGKTYNTKKIAVDLLGRE